MPIFTDYTIKPKCLRCKVIKDLSQYRQINKKTGVFYYPTCKKCSYESKCGKKIFKFVNNKDGEIWYNILNSNRYSISNYLRIKTVNKYSEKLINPCVGKNGYYFFNFQINGGIIGKNIHRLIAEMFIPNPNNYPCINHKNGIKTDNSLENLEWCTYRYNNKHAIDNMLRVQAKGERINTSKVTNKQALEIFKSRIGRRELSIKYGVSLDCIDDIKSGITWNWLTNKVYSPKNKVFIGYNGLSKRLSWWAKYFNVSPSTLYQRLKNKQTMEHIFKYYEKKNAKI